VSERILSLFSEVIWLNADRILDTKLGSVFVVDEFQAAIVTVPLWVAVQFERDPLVVLEIVAVSEYVTDAEFECTLVFVPVERVEIVTDETVQLVAVFSGAPVPRW